MLSYWVMTPWVPVMSLSEENTIYMPSVGSVLEHSRRLSGGKKTQMLPKQEFLSSGCHLLGVSFATSLKPNLLTNLTTLNTTENNCIISYAQNTTLLQTKAFYWNVQVTIQQQSSGPRVAQWLRHCATSRMVPGSISGGVTGDFFRDSFRRNHVS